MHAAWLLQLYVYAWPERLEQLYTFRTREIGTVSLAICVVLLVLCMGSACKQLTDIGQDHQTSQNIKAMLHRHPLGDWITQNVRYLNY